MKSRVTIFYKGERNYKLERSLYALALNYGGINDSYGIYIGLSTYVDILFPKKSARSNFFGKSSGFWTNTTGGWPAWECARRNWPGTDGTGDPSPTAPWYANVKGGGLC